MSDGDVSSLGSADADNRNGANYSPCQESKTK